MIDRIAPGDEPDGMDRRVVEFGEPEPGWMVKEAVG